MIAQSITRTRRVAPNTAPAVISGDGLQPSSAPWCSSRLTRSNPWESAYPAISTVAR